MQSSAGLFARQGSAALVTAGRHTGSSCAGAAVIVTVAGGERNRPSRLTLEQVR